MSSSAKGYWMWCGRCSRCYCISNNKSRYACRYRAIDGCDGLVLLDGFEWEDARLLVPGIVYEARPEEGRRYDIPHNRLYLLLEDDSVRVGVAAA